MEIDHNKIYMKVMNHDEIHNGYQYKDGLNIDTNEFNDDISELGVEGRLHITSIENIIFHTFYDGEHIRLVKIPEDARVIDEGEFLGCDKIILLDKFSLSEYFDKWFDKDKFDWKYSDSLCRWFPKYFDKWFDKDKFNWKFSYLLCMYCSEYLKKWFDKDKFDWKYSKYLYEYCIDYKHIWEKYVKN